MTSIRVVALAAVLTIAQLASAAGPPSIPWHSVPEVALHVARAQQKMLLVYYRGACGKCNDEMDAMFVAAASDDVFMHAFDTYLPLRLTAGTSAPHPMLVELAKKHEAPLIVYVKEAAGEAG